MWRPGYHRRPCWQQIDYSAVDLLQGHIQGGMHAYPKPHVMLASQPTFINVTPAGHPCIPAGIHRPSVIAGSRINSVEHSAIWDSVVTFADSVSSTTEDRNHSLMSYSDDYVSVDLAITFVILDNLNTFLIDWLIDGSNATLTCMLYVRVVVCHTQLCYSATGIGSAVRPSVTSWYSAIVYVRAFTR